MRRPILLLHALAFVAALSALLGGLSVKSHYRVLMMRTDVSTAAALAMLPLAFPLAALVLRGAARVKDDGTLAQWFIDLYLLLFGVAILPTIYLANVDLVAPRRVAGSCWFQHAAAGISLFLASMGGTSGWRALLRHARDAVVGTARTGRGLAVVLTALAVLAPAAWMQYRWLLELPASLGAFDLTTDTGRDHFRQWYAARRRSTEPEPSRASGVVVVTYLDYQCPPCRDAHHQMKSRIPSRPGLQLVTRDFPLDPACNPSIRGTGTHPLACEAAIAVRLARAHGRQAAMQDWLFSNQEGLTLAGIRSAAQSEGLVTDFDARREQALEEIQDDVAAGLGLGVRGTPSFYVNGVALGTMDQVALAVELEGGRQPAEAP